MSVKLPPDKGETGDLVFLEFDSKWKTLVHSYCKGDPIHAIGTIRHYDPFSLEQCEIPNAVRN